MAMKQSGFFLRIPPARALLEALLLGSVLWFGLLLFQYTLSAIFLQIGIGLLVSLACVLLCALRLQRFKGSWWRQSIFEFTFAGMLSFVLNSISLAIILTLAHGIASNAVRVNTIKLYEVGVFALVLDWAAFVFFRSAIRLLLYWNHLRREQLLWALTHAHIMVVVLGAGMLILVLDVLVGLISHNFYAIVPTTLVLAFLSGIALVVVIPPSALASYLVVRRATRRLKTLTAATSALRGGNYAVRVPVMGEDEVAQLQTDFNVMAADLERAMHALKEERDTVAGLLESRRELIANVSHELRTPMATLRSYLETTLAHWDDAPPSPATLQHDLQVMEDEAIRLQALVDDLFMLSRAEVGRLTLRCEPTDVGKLVRRVVETRAPLAWRASRVEVVADVLCSLPLALVDGIRVEQALQNLLHNAVRHTSPGGIVAVAVSEEAEVVVIHVKDTGEGIAPEDLPHIWERFYQAGGSSTRMGGGTGLGLALVKEWIEGMGGTAGVESVVGEGSCFTLRLPRAC